MKDLLKPRKFLDRFTFGIITSGMVVVIIVAQCCIENKNLHPLEVLVLMLIACQFSVYINEKLRRNFTEELDRRIKTILEQKKEDVEKFPGQIPSPGSCDKSD